MKPLAPAARGDEERFFATSRAVGRSGTAVVKPCTAAGVLAGR